MIPPEPPMAAEVTERPEVIEGPLIVLNLRASK